MTRTERHGYLVCWRVWLTLGALACSSGGVQPVPRTPENMPPRVTVLFDVWSEREANVVAVDQGRVWKSPLEFGLASLQRIAAGRHADYTLLPSVTAETTASTRGRLAGGMREYCYEVQAALAAPTAAYGFAVLSTAGTVQPVPLTRVPVARAQMEAVAKVLAEASHIKVTPVVERAYHIDLNGDGQREFVLQATHPELHGDPPEYKAEYYSLLVVIEESGKNAAAYTGYMQGSDRDKHFEVLTLDAIADLDFDGKLELLLRARHAEGWQTRVIRYDPPGLTELFRSVGGEGECPEASE